MESKNVNSNVTGSGGSGNEGLNDDNIQSSEYFQTSEVDSSSVKTGSQSDHLRGPNRFLNNNVNQSSLAQMTMTSLLDDSSSKSGCLDDSVGGEWSKQSLEHFFNPLESFLDIQLRRERSSKRRCREVVRKRELDQQRMFVETKLREFDEKINLNGLLKRSKEALAVKKLVEPAAGNSSSNFRIVDHPIPHCSRCMFFQRCYEENGAMGHNHFVENGNRAKNKLRQPRRIRLPKISLTTSNTASRQNFMNNFQTGSLPYLNNFSMNTRPPIKF